MQETELAEKTTPAAPSHEAEFPIGRLIAFLVVGAIVIIGAIVLEARM